MPEVEQRRAFIEFLGKKTIRITTLYKQKEFELGNIGTIDLINLGTAETYNAYKPLSNFIGIVHEVDDKFSIGVWIKERNGSVGANWRRIGSCSLENKSELFKVKIIT